MSSRGVRVADALTNEQVNEIADAQAGVLPQAVELATAPKPVTLPEANPPAVKETEDAPSVINVATVEKDGKVKFEDSKDLKEFIR